MSPGVLISFEKKFPELSQSVQASHLLVELGVHDQMEVVVDLVKLCDVFVLHLPSCEALSAWRCSLWEAHLVDYDVVDIDFEFRKLYSEALCLVQTQELRDAHSDESCLFWVFELVVDLDNLLFHHV